MEYRTLGNTGLQISAVSFGAAPLGNMFGAVEEKAALTTVRTAVECGVNFFDTSPYYGNGLSEERLGKALQRRRHEVLIGTKAGRYGDDHFDYTPNRIRRSLEASLRRLHTDYVDIFQLHDIEFVELDDVFGDSYQELGKLRDEGKCRFIGMTGYPMRTLRRAVTETELDTVLSYARYTLLNTQLATELLPACQRRGTAAINAAAHSLGLLTATGTKFQNHPASSDIKAAASRAARYCWGKGADIGFLASQFSIQHSQCPTTVVGTATTEHLQNAIRAVTTPIDEELLAGVLAQTADVRRQPWISGLPENNEYKTR